MTLDGDLLPLINSGHRSNAGVQLTAAAEVISPKSLRIGVVRLMGFPWAIFLRS